MTRREDALRWRPFAGHALFVALIVAGTAAFTLFFTWLTFSDTLLVTGYDWLALLVAGMLVGILALLVELALVRWRGLWPVRPWAFYLRLILFCAWWMSLGNSLNGLILAPPFRGIFRWWLSMMPRVAVLYTPMALPFALIVGSAAAALLRKNYGRNRPL